MSLVYFSYCPLFSRSPPKPANFYEPPLRLGKGLRPSARTQDRVRGVAHSASQGLDLKGGREVGKRPRADELVDSPQGGEHSLNEEAQGETGNGAHS